ncbi:MAG: hypothetical protein QN183_07275 [Armatimonadota bacterium]|nr:hypothetical protein [Armatimonadota bacterium]MDR7486972.1 hypothetical protein [Armatimonadota bacterium]MDR7536148.1 hypothetical protein [Armatimonadota bacterium]
MEAREEQPCEEQALGDVLVTLARWIGQPVDKEAVARVSTIVAGSLRDWRALAGATPPETEPMWCGRWLEAGDAQP